jgi:hypothetical protein
MAHQCFKQLGSAQTRGCPRRFRRSRKRRRGGRGRRRRGRRHDIGRRGGLKKIARGFLFLFHLSSRFFH